MKKIRRRMITCKCCHSYEQKDQRLPDKNFCFSCAQEYIDQHAQHIEMLLDSKYRHEWQEEFNVQDSEGQSAGA